MIEAYFRPEKLEDAVRLIAQDPLSTVPLGGGNVLSKVETGKIKVVDLQALKLNGIHLDNLKLVIGACATLQSIIENEETPAAIRQSAVKEGTINQRRTGTLAGDLVSTRGKSPLGAVLKAIETIVITEPGQTEKKLDDWLKETTPGLATRFEIPINVRLSYTDISKTPQDFPIGYSVLVLSPDSLYTWITGLKKEKDLLIFKGKSKAELSENAHSHFRTNKIFSTYIQQMINLFLDRLFDEISSAGAGR